MTTLAAILLAAGLSERMGRPKPLLPWLGTTLVRWQVAQLRAAGIDDVVLVTGNEAARVERSLLDTDVRFARNDDFREGRATSLQRGAVALKDESEAVVILNIDQPRPAWATRRLVEAWRKSKAAIVQPRHGGKGGHPIVVDGRLIPELRAVSDSTQGLRAVTERHAAEMLALPFENDVVLLDLNTPAEYETALTRFEAGDWDISVT